MALTVMEKHLRKVGDGVHQLPVCDARMKVPVHVFMTESLIAGLEESIWPQMINAASLEGVEWAGVSADGHSGYGVPIGSIVASRTHLYPTAAGYDISCGMARMKQVCGWKTSQCDVRWDTVVPIGYSWQPVLDGLNAGSALYHPFSPPCCP